MKKTIAILSLVYAIFIFTTKPSHAAFVQFNPKTAQFVSPSQKQTSSDKTTVKVSAYPTSKVQGVATANESYIKNLVAGTVNQMLIQGLLKGEKGDKGDSGSIPNFSYDGNASGFQQVYIPGAVVAPDVGTFFSATNLSSDNITSASANLGDIDSDGNLTIAGNADLQGSTSIATGSIISLNVGSLISDSGAYLSDGGDWVNASSRELKENLSTTSPQDILSKIDSLPIYTWNYKTQNASTTHMSPMAEDFYQTFGLGGENGSKAISTVDPAGVALAGIQGLNEKLKSILDFSWVLDGLKALGIEIQNGFVKIQKLAADFISTKELEVGSEDQPTGITIYDRVTGQPVCIYSENNILKSDSGKCETGLITQSPIQTPSPPAPAEDRDSEPEPITEMALTTTPDSTASTTRDLTLTNNN